MTLSKGEELEDSRGQAEREGRREWRGSAGRRRRDGGRRRNRRLWVIHHCSEYFLRGSIEEAATNGPGEPKETIDRPFGFVGSALSHHGFQHEVQNEGVIGVCDEHESILAWSNSSPWQAVTD